MLQANEINPRLAGKSPTIAPKCGTRSCAGVCLKFSLRGISTQRLFHAAFKLDKRLNWRPRSASPPCPHGNAIPPSSLLLSPLSPCSRPNIAHVSTRNFLFLSLYCSAVKLVGCVSVCLAVSDCQAVCRYVRRVRRQSLASRGKPC